ncbi:MAG TPA: GldM family protein [Ferruginibacter sp.]|nr:GldM family protein [Ferruginibacter sp.]
MRHVLLFSLLSICAFPLSTQLSYVENSMVSPGRSSLVEKKDKGFNIGSQEPGNEKMLAAVFKIQEFCRAEVNDFEFETKFEVVSATVYFSGTNFTRIEKGNISSNSLKPLKSLMNRCAAGSVVIFDNVKVLGPDKLVRSISGISIMLH